MAKVENKTQLTEASVEAFLNTVTDEQRADSYRVIEIMQRVTGESPKMWGAAIIGFGVQHRKYDSGREMDWMLVGFSPRKGNWHSMASTTRQNRSNRVTNSANTKQTAAVSTSSGCRISMKTFSKISSRVLSNTSKASSNFSSFAGLS